ncbi:MAG: tetratricopeptide repeat protein, partial [Acidobacteriota bacterium]
FTMISRLPKGRGAAGIARRRHIPISGAARLALICVGLGLLLPAGLRASTAEENERLYVAAIKAWLDEPTDETAMQLVELEASAAGSRLERLAEAEERVVNDFSRLDPAALMPIAALHRRAYRLHLEAESKPGVRHSALRLRHVVDRYARRSKSPDAHAVAGRQWMAMALTLLARGGEQLRTAVACLSEGLGHLKARSEHAGVREARIRSLHIRATALERIGTPTKALDDLKDLLELDPGHREAQLRRAVSLMHAERLDDAEPRLAELLGADVPDWMQVIAAQQLARLYLDTGRLGKALDTLRDAHARFPGNARLATLLAYAERPQWDTSSTRVRHVLKTWPEAVALRPRARYEGPLHDNQVVRRQVRKDLEDHLVAARAALIRWEADRVD